MYVANSGDDHELYGPCPGGSLDRYALDPLTAGLPSEPTESFEHQTYAVVVAPGGARVFALTALGLVQFDVAPDGHLTERARQPITWFTTRPAGLTIAPDGRRIYVAYAERPYSGPSNRLLTFDCTGDVLVQVGTPQSVDVTPYAVHITPDSRFVYVGSASEWAVFETSTTGVPLQLAGSPFLFKSRDWGDAATVLVTLR